jgi:hypothetical protein
VQELCVAATRSGVSRRGCSLSRGQQVCAPCWWRMHSAWWTMT